MVENREFNGGDTDEDAGAGPLKSVAIHKAQFALISYSTEDLLRRLSAQRQKLQLFDLNSVQNASVTDVADKIQIVAFRVGTRRNKGSVEYSG